MSRASHYQRTSKAAQRQGVAKPKLPARDTDTTWIPEFVSSIQGITTPFNSSSIIAASLGSTEEERVTKLRELSKRGILRMSAHRQDGIFIEYRWELDEGGRL
jgi:hypothetical protein